MSAENLVKHYWDCARVLEPEGHTRKLLKSYYMTKCRKLAKSTIWMPKEKFSPHTMCPRCSSKWNETNYKMFLKPQQIAYSTKARKQIEKLQQAKTSIENRRALTRKQRKRAKWLQKRVLNSVVIQCELCEHKTKIEMQKPSKTERDSVTVDTADLEESIPLETVTHTPVNTKKKNKKNKDKTAGLKLDKSKNLATKNIEAQNKTISNKQEVPTVTIKPQPSNKVVAKANPPNKIAAKPKANLSQPLKAKKQKQQKTKPANNTTSKVQSKTQQQNSLLQLAALLKSQTAAKTGANATQKRLETLLK